MSQKLNISDLKDIFEMDLTKKEPTPQKAVENTKMTGQNKEILMKFELYDTEHTRELDVYQLKKYIQREWGVCLSEETIKYHCGQTFLEKAYKVQYTEFIAFHKYIAANIEEIRKENTESVFDTFEKQFADTPGVDIQFKYLDKNLFVINNFEKPHALVSMKQKQPNATDKYHSLMYTQIFSPTISVFINQKSYVNTLDPHKDKSLPITMASAEMFDVDSLLQSDTRKTSARKKKNKFLFQFYNPKLSQEDFLYSTNLSSSQPRNVNNLLKVKRPSIVNITHFKPYQHFDTFFCRMSLYDMSYNKLTSDFYFVIDSKVLKAHVERRESLGIPIVSMTLGQDFIKETENYVVLEVFKPMDADINFTRDYLTEDSKRDQKMMKKFADKMRDSEKVFEQKGLLQLVLFSATAVKFKGAYDNLKLVRPIGDPKDVPTMIKDVEKMKSAGEWSFVFKPSKKEITHHDGLIKFYNPEKTEGEQVTTMTELNLYDKEEIFMDYENLFFLYPTEICLGKERKKSGICCSIFVRENDDFFVPGKSNVLNAVYPQDNKLIQQLSNAFTTSVSIEKVGHFIDEVKIQLPFPLTEKHHILIQVRDVSVEDGSEGKLFYAKLPLLDNGHIISNGEHTVQIMKDMTNKYLNYIDNYDVTKIFVKVNVRIVSTIYPQNPEIYRFLVGGLGVESVLGTLFRTDLIHFLPSVLTKCVEIIGTEKKEDIFKVFEIFKMIDERRETNIDQEMNYRIYKNSIFVDAISHFVPYRLADGRYICDILLTQLPVIFDLDKTDVKYRMRYSWIIFSLLIKGIIGYYNDYKVFEYPNFHDFNTTQNKDFKKNCFKTNVQKYSKFIKEFCDGEVVGASVIREANLCFAEFIRDASLLWRKDEIVEIIDEHLDTLSMLKVDSYGLRVDFTQLLRLEFVSVLIENDQIFALNGPQLLEVQEINKLNDLLAQRHTQMFILLRQFFLLIMSQDKSISKMALEELLIVTNKFDLDNSLSEQGKRDKYFSMLLPFVLFMLDDSDKINEWKAKDCFADLNDIKSLYVVFFFIIKNLREETIQQWLVSDFLPSLLNSLLMHIRRALLLFSRYPYTFLANSTMTFKKELKNILVDFHKRGEPTTPPLFTRSNTSTTKSHISFQTSTLSSSARPLSKGKSSFFEENKSRKDDDSKIGFDSDKKITGFVDNANRAHLTTMRVRQNVLSSGESTFEKSVNEELVVEIALIAMDLVETTIGTLIREESTQALDRAQDIISSVLFEVGMTDSYMPSLYDFIRIIVTTYRVFIFTKPNKLSMSLLKNLLKQANSTNALNQKFAKNLIFIFTKTNFVAVGNTVSTVVNATSALSELQFNDLGRIGECVNNLLELAKQYYENFDIKLEKCIALSLQDGLRKMKSLQRVHKMYQALDVGDLDVFITFVTDCTTVIDEILDFTMKAEPSIVNGYIEMKIQIVKMMRQDEVFKMIAQWIVLIKTKAQSASETFIPFLKGKIEYLEMLYKLCQQKVDDLDRYCVSSATEMKELEAECLLNKTIGEQLLSIVKNSITIDSCDLENMTNDQLIRKIEVLEKEQQKRASDINAVLEQYTSFDETLKTFRLASNPLFPVTSLDMSDGVKRVLLLHQSRIKAVNSHLHTRTSFDSETERYKTKIVDFENIIHSKFIDIVTDIMKLPMNVSFMKESVSKIESLVQLYSTDVSHLESKKIKMGGLRPTWEIAYYSWEEAVLNAISCMEWLLQLLKTVKSNEENVQQMRGWFKVEREFIQNVLSSYLWDGFYTSWDKVTMRASNDFLEVLSQMSLYFMTNMNTAKAGYKRAGTLLQELRKRKKLPLGFPYIQHIKEEHFEQLSMVAELYQKKREDELTRENIRKQYAALFKQFYVETDKLMERSGGIPMSEIAKIQNLRDKLLVFEEQKVIKLNRYCDLESMDQTVWVRCQTLGIQEKDATPKSPRTSFIKTYDGSRSPSLIGSNQSPQPSTTTNTFMQRAKRAGDDLRDITGFFVDNKGIIRADCFHDLSYGQRDVFNEDLKLVIDEISKILSNLIVLNNFNTTDPQLILEKFYRFAMDYVSAPQLHMTWITNLAKQHRERFEFIEAGMCEVHLINFIHHLLPENERKIEVSILNKTFGNFIPDTSTPPNPQFSANLSEESLLKHITAAYEDFENGQLPWYGLTVSSIVIPYYTEKKKLKELVKTHEYVNKMYDLMVKHNEDGQIKDFLQFYYVKFFGSVFGEMNKKSFIYATKKDKVSQLIIEINKILPVSFSGEKHYLRFFEQVNSEVENCGDKECYILWTNVQPVYEKGEYVQFTSRFIYDDMCLDRKEGDELLEIEKAPAVSLYKKRTVMDIELVLPGLLGRQTVIKESVVQLGPIEIAIEEIETRKRGVEKFLEESKKFFGEVAFDYITFLQKKIGDFFFGYKDQNDIAYGKLNAYDRMKVLEIIEVFFSEEYDLKNQEILFEMLKETINLTKEGLAIIKENSKARTSSASLENLIRHSLRIERVLDMLDTKMNEKKEH
ncbi:hypothetical protein EIN_504470 [Entamoeba invadens IP1]|uniref:DOCKER domain-containing protein n=1 Tax=Entamoeba invadens IP1 TaxID=370355 RepID=A0A0A1U7C1_ENTIV|nr:hypothetical protein EIN_504470 [Entamoeba invadens IP1]ELP90291.1 hypothetical protein EIN_504470 [Entamoeba invadens IP1]|eukprot:XP_004257062.1 hypothetical protein EIN_504470 [Entamoeba invadens IP1]